MSWRDGEHDRREHERDAVTVRVRRRGRAAARRTRRGAPTQHDDEHASRRGSTTGSCAAEASEEPGHRERRTRRRRPRRCRRAVEVGADDERGDGEQADQRRRVGSRPLQHAEELSPPRTSAPQRDEPERARRADEQADDDDDAEDESGRRRDRRASAARRTRRRAWRHGRRRRRRRRRVARGGARPGSSRPAPSTARLDRAWSSSSMPPRRSAAVERRRARRRARRSRDGVSPVASSGSRPAIATSSSSLRRGRGRGASATSSQSLARSRHVGPADEVRSTARVGSSSRIARHLPGRRIGPVGKPKARGSRRRRPCRAVRRLGDVRRDRLAQARTRASTAATGSSMPAPSQQSQRPRRGGGGSAAGVGRRAVAAARPAVATVQSQTVRRRWGRRLGDPAYAAWTAAIGPRQSAALGGELLDVARFSDASVDSPPPSNVGCSISSTVLLRARPCDRLQPQTSSSSCSLWPSEPVDLGDELVGELLELLLGPLEVVGGDVAVVLERLELVAGLTAHVAHRHPARPRRAGARPSRAPCGAPR